MTHTLVFCFPSDNFMKEYVVVMGYLLLLLVFLLFRFQLSFFQQMLLVDSLNIVMLLGFEFYSIS